jgi:putative transcriptional regulator
MMAVMNARPLHADSARRAAAVRRHRLIDVAVLLVAAALVQPLAAQPKLAQGVLLVATPEIGDRSWEQTVVLVLHHDSNGTLGVAINRPTVVAPEEIVPDLGELPEAAGAVFRGGPVGPTQLVFLVRNPPSGMLQTAPLIVDGIYASGDLGSLPRLVEASDDGRRLRIYAGHAEWAPGQAEREVAEGQWTVTAGTAERVFSAQPEILWQRLQNAGEELLVDAGSAAGNEASARAAMPAAGLSSRGRVAATAASISPR